MQGQGEEKDKFEMQYQTCKNKNFSLFSPRNFCFRYVLFPSLKGNNNNNTWEGVNEAIKNFKQTLLREYKIMDI